MGIPVASALENLASPDPAERFRGARQVFQRTLGEDDHDLLGRFKVALAVEWRETGADRERLLSGLVTTLTEDENLLTIEMAAIALAAQGGDGLTALVDLIDHPDFAVRSKAIIGIGVIDRSARWAVPILVRAISREPIWLVVADLVRALGRIGGREAADALVSILGHLDSGDNPDLALKGEVMRALANVRLHDPIDTQA